MAKAEHTSPDGQLRFQVFARVSHVNLLAGRRDHAEVVVRRDRVERGFLGRKKFVADGDARAVMISTAFEDAGGTDISGRIGLSDKNQTGRFERSTTFVFAGAPLPSDLGNDARSVKRARIVYRLPFEQTSRELSGT